MTAETHRHGRGDFLMKKRHHLPTRPPPPNFPDVARWWEKGAPGNGQRQRATNSETLCFWPKRAWNRSERTRKPGPFPERKPLVIGNCYIDGAGRRIGRSAPGAHPRSQRAWTAQKGNPLPTHNYYIDFFYLTCSLLNQQGYATWDS